MVRTALTLRPGPAALAVLAGVLAFATSGVLAAQDPEDDPRWLPWLACWEPADSTAKAEAGNTLLCVVPAGESAAEVMKVAGGAIESRERIDPGAGPQYVERDGCRGRETAEWSPDGMRLYLTSEYACEGGVARRASGLMAIAFGGDWLDVRGLAGDGRRGVSVIRYREAFPPASEIPEEISVALDGLEEPRRAAQEIAAGRLFATSVIEASERLDAPVVEAWLVERGLGFTVKRDELVEMEAAGVPLTIIDLVVALSYPERFAVNRPTRIIERARPRVANVYDDYYYPYRGGYGAYYGYGWYPGDSPVAVVSAAPAPARPHGKVVKDKGYQEGTSSSSSSSSSDTRTRTDDSSSSSSTSSSSSSSSSSSERTAKPRP